MLTSLYFFALVGITRKNKNITVSDHFLGLVMPSERGVPKIRPAQGNMGTYFGITLL